MSGILLQFQIQHLAMQKQHGIDGLILRHRADAAIYRQMGQKRLLLGRAHLRRMNRASRPLLVPEHMAAVPARIILPGLARVLLLRRTSRNESSSFIPVIISPV